MTVEDLLRVNYDERVIAGDKLSFFLQLCTWKTSRSFIMRMEPLESDSFVPTWHLIM